MQNIELTRTQFATEKNHHDSDSSKENPIFNDFNPHILWSHLEFEHTCWNVDDIVRPKHMSCRSLMLPEGAPMLAFVVKHLGRTTRGPNRPQAATGAPRKQSAPAIPADSEVERSRLHLAIQA